MNIFFTLIWAFKTTLCRNWNFVGAPRVSECDMIKKKKKKKSQVCNNLSNSLYNNNVLSWKNVYLSEHYWAYIVQKQLTEDGVALTVALFTQRDTTLSPQWQFANYPPLFVYTEPSNCSVKINPIHLWWWRLCVFKVFPDVLLSI